MNNTLKIIPLIAIFGLLLPTAYAQSTPPDTISDLIATPGNGQVFLTWTAPFDNGSTIKSYKVILWQTGTDVFTIYPNIASTTTQATASGLKNGVSYSFKVVAINAGGEGPDSNIVSSTPSTSPSPFVPDKITTLNVVRGDGKVNLTWTPPFDNGSEITSYKIHYWEIDSEKINTKTVTGTATGAQITGLTNQVSYIFKVVAINSVGHGPDSNLVSATPSASTTASVPNKVRGVTAIASDGRVFLSWIQPSANGSPITSYKVIVFQAGSTSYTTYPNLSTETKTTIIDLQNGVKYNFKIAAVNALGTGKESDAVSATPDKRVPIEITNLRASPGNGKVTLSWSIPPSATDLITSYWIREYNTGEASFVTHTILDKSTQVTIPSLINGVPYGFSVIAVTADGVGPNSKIVYSTPAAPKSPQGAPAKITDLKATSGNNQVRLSWTIPADNGSPIIGYNIQKFKQGDNFFTTIQKDASSNSVLVSGLTNGVTYDFKVTAKNSIGISQESNTVTATPGTLEQKFVMPSWVKNNAKWWSEGLISDIEYVNAIEYLLNQGIIKIK